MNKLQVVNFQIAPDTVQITPDVLGVELNNPAEFAEGTSHISIARLTMKPNGGFPPHKHPHNHVLAILLGGGFLEYRMDDGQDGCLEFKAGDVFNVPGTDEHAVSAGPEGVTMLSIGSPPMHLIDPERMVFMSEIHRWMVPHALDEQI